MKKIYPRTGDTQTVYLNAVVKDPSIEVGDYTIYNDFVSEFPADGKEKLKRAGQYDVYQMAFAIA